MIGVSIWALAIGLLASAAPSSDLPVSTPTPPPVYISPAAPPAPPPPPAYCPKARRATLAKGHITEDDYPKEALEGGQEGTAVARFTLSKTGIPRACAIVQSSGSPSLDRATCAIIVERFRFRPALDCRGKPEQLYINQRIAWRFPTLAEALLPAPTARAQLDIDGNGRPSDCRIIVAQPGPSGLANAQRLCRDAMKQSFPIRRNSAGAPAPYRHEIEAAQGQAERD